VKLVIIFKDSGLLLSTSTPGNNYTEFHQL
jgi:hypothetical protein